MDLFYSVFIAILVGFFGGIAYLIYIPFKKKLINSGRLTDKLNRRINWSYILSLCLFFAYLYYHKDDRTSSKDRLEKISKVKLPSNFIVLKDEYQDMIQDYCILYDIQFDRDQKKEFVQSIKSSPFYNEQLFDKNDFSGYRIVDSVEAVWVNSPKGYDFIKPYRQPTYHIEFDTLNGMLTYQECCD